MIQQIEDLCRFYAQRYHVPVTCLADSWQVDAWDHSGLAVALPGNGTVTKQLGDAIFLHEPAFAKIIIGDIIVIDDMPIARISKQCIVSLIWPKNLPAVALVRRIIDQHLPRLCRQYRHAMRDQLVEAISTCVHDRKRELQSSIREDSYELERLSLQVMQLSRKLETDRHLLEMFQRSPEWIRQRANHGFCDLMKLVPGVYVGFRIEDDCVIGTTHSIDIEYDGCTYAFGAYDVEVNLRQGKVAIGGGTNVNGYVHPHVTDEKSNICWGSCGHLVSRLVGELDLFGLYQLVHQFLTSYNPSDPYQRIEKWDPHWEEESDDDEPYCSWCDEYGHDIDTCESCWWCDHCNQHVDHEEEDCPNRPKETSEEEADAVAEQAVA
jgi:hypothetical protein